ncbi:hypothetical protein [Gaetbulibacter sp. NE]|uniref:hypothetical protein n=1 Tax=unclassified Gaetbulibacter TaxID=2625143 RepID=UPI0021D0B6CB|nr:hypothetical protein [Gaetbulibacter sp. NE]
MNHSTRTKPPIWFWIISVIALIWNLMGVMAYLGQAYMSDADLSALPEAEQALYTNVPAWATAAFAIGVFGGALGCLLLLLRKKWAKSLFIISLIGVLIQTSYNLFVSDALDVYGTKGLIMPIIILIIALYLIMFSNKSIAKGWIS